MLCVRVNFCGKIFFCVNLCAVRPDMASRMGGIVYSGVLGCIWWRPEFACFDTPPILGVFQRVPNWGGSENRGSSASRMSYLLRCSSGGYFGCTSVHTCVHSASRMSTPVFWGVFQRVPNERF